MTRARGLIVLTLGTAACTHTDLPRNAPGIVDVEKRPETDVPQTPRDPGEHLVTVSYGAFAGGGVADGSTPLRGYYGIGPEISLGYGTRDTSHYGDDFWIAPERGLGLNLGLIALTSEGRGIGPAYGEAAVRWGSLATLGAGWAWDPNDKTHGPQLTLLLAILYFRASHQLDTSTSLSVGLMIKGQHGWIWSR